MDGNSSTCDATVTVNDATGQCSVSDEDGDGVLDNVDICQGTNIPEAIPTRRLGINRFVLADGDGNFDSTAPRGRGPQKSFAIEDTSGCSCDQIIEALGLRQGHSKFGCSISAMEDFIAQLPPPVDCVVSEFGPFDECTVECGGGFQTRTRVILVSPAYGGAACPLLSETVACNTQPCPVGGGAQGGR